MLMTHGDSFRRRDGLLKRLVVEGGLTEISIRVDTTQRGRVGHRRDAKTESELNPLRAEFGAMLRQVRAETRIAVRSATTMTITPENIGGVADVVAWLQENPDDFFMTSFQPIAQVGRTEDGLGDSVDVEHLWREIARGLYGSDQPSDVAKLLGGQKWLGHPGCSRFVHGVFSARAADSDGSGALHTFHPVRQQGDATDERIVDGFLARFGGLSYAWHWLKRFNAASPWRALRDLQAGRLKAHGFLFVSHHFMSRQQLETPLGQERVKHCVFQVPINSALTSMCEVNAPGIREAYYADITTHTTSAPSDEHSLVS